MSDPLGQVRRILLARACAEEIRSRRVATGGAVTAFLCFLLDEGIVDAVVCAMRARGLYGRAIIARTKEEVLRAAGTHWELVPSLRLLRDAVRKGAVKRAAVVVTPCQARFVRSMKLMPLLESDFGEQVHVIVGLFCMGTFSHEFFRAFIRERYGVDPERVTEVRLEGNRLIVEVEGREPISIPVDQTVSLVQLGCLLCDDYAALHADIAAGAVSAAPRWTLVLLRTPLGERLFMEAVEKGYIEIKDAGSDVIEEVRKRALEKVIRADRLREMILG